MADGQDMVGCDGCGAVVRIADAACPVCGTPWPSGMGPLGATSIPIRRYGKVPPPTGDVWEATPVFPPPLALPQKAALVVGALALAGLSAWASYSL